MKEQLEKYKKDGFFVEKNVLTEEEVKKFRKLLDNYFREHPSVKGDGGKLLPGWAGVTPELEELDFLHDDPRILRLAEAVLGKGFVFAGHSDLHQNKLTGWHRDIYDYGRGGGRWPHWEDDFHVIKVCFLLQDHVENMNGLWMDAGSHRPNVEGNQQHLYSTATEAIVFDQRIHHRGQQRHYLESFGQHRYLITYAYGVDNEHTAIHRAGANKRQTAQRAKMC